MESSPEGATVMSTYYSHCIMFITVNTSEALAHSVPSAPTPQGQRENASVPAAQSGQKSIIFPRYYFRQNDIGPTSFQHKNSENCCYQKRFAIKNSPFICFYGRGCAPDPAGRVYTYSTVYTVGQKSKPANFSNNFVYCHCQSIFIIFSTYTQQEICYRGMYS